jgi:ribosomal protein S12 methylthiotransferase accessory factor
MLFSEQQYAERERRNAGADGFTRIPKPLHEKERLWWSKMWSLPDQKTKFCPTAYLYFHSEALQDPTGASTCIPDSNGVATGSTYTEAVLQGLLELIERDAVALWWYPRTAVPRVRLESFASEFLDHCVHYHRKIGRELWVLDVTSDLGIPTFVGLSRKRLGEQQILMGFGAHVDARIAIVRAVAECNQLLSGVEAQLKSQAAYCSATTRWLRNATIEREYYLQGRADDLVDAAKYERGPDSVSAALQRCLDAVHRAGLVVYGLDLTRPDIELKVVRVLCPGLRHFWARHAPGRLYEVPFRLGRVQRRLQEAELNPIAMFL